MRYGMCHGERTHDMAAAAPAVCCGRRFRPRGLLRPPPRRAGGRGVSCWRAVRVAAAADAGAECGGGRTIMGCRECRWWGGGGWPDRERDGEDGGEDVSGGAPSSAVVAPADADVACSLSAGGGAGAGGGVQSRARRTTNALSNPGLTPTCKIISSDGWCGDKGGLVASDVQKGFVHARLCGGRGEEVWGRRVGQVNMPGGEGRECE